MKTDKYLTELGIPHKEQSMENCYDNLWKRITAKFHCWKQRRKYFITSYDTFNFDDYMTKQLYAGLRKYVDCAESMVVLDDENIKYTWQGKDYTQIEMINMILERIKIYYEIDNYLPEWNDNYKTIYDLPRDYYDEYNIKEEEGEQALQEAWQMWSMIYRACWW